MMSVAPCVHPARSHFQRPGACFLSGTKLPTAGNVARMQNLRSKPGYISCASNQGPSTVAVTGATGLIGSRLVAKLAYQKCKVKVLTRNVSQARSKLPYPGVTFHGTGSWNSAVCGCDAVVNLAGEPIATRWSPSIRTEIKASRVQTTKDIAAAINSCPADTKPDVLVNASAVGYYGTSLTNTMNESSPSGSDYLAEICREWEAAAQEAKGIRVVMLRTGIVLAKEGGALGRMLPVFQIFAGGPLGTGQQWVSWIHRDDVVGLITAAISSESFNGVYNATAPNPVRMGEFCNIMGQVLGRPSWLPVPEFALRGLLSDGAMLVLEGQRVLPSRTQDAGYRFKFSEVKDALGNLFSS